MPQLSRLSGIFLACALFSGTALCATTASQMTLSDVADIAVLRQQHSTNANGDIPYQTSSWLAASPSLGLSYLGSDESDGTDETEVRLNLPFKSSFGRDTDRELRVLTENITQAENLRRRLYFSGLIRESLWSLRIANTKKDYALKKISLLEDFLERQRALFQARASSQYSLLLVRQELANTKAEHQAFTWEARNWLNQYQQVTGQKVAPTALTESSSQTELDYSQHPDMRLLNLGWQRQQKLIAAGSSKTSPVNLALTAKRLDNRQLNENQYGLAVDIPLTVFDVASESSRSEWQQASRNYWKTHDELQLDLKRGWEELRAESDYLRERQGLLDESLEVGAKLLTETKGLLDQSEIPYEFWMRRTLGNIDNQAAAAINRLLIGQNAAKMIQAAGIPL